MNTLQEKLNPNRFTAMSGKMAAIVGCIVNARYTEPAIEELAVSSDGFVFARLEGDVGLNEFIGTESDLNSNWSRLLDAAGLTEEERASANALKRERIGR